MIKLEQNYPLVLDEIDKLESKLIPLQSHIRGIAEYFQSKEHPFYLDTANWFWISSSINSVDFNRIKFDSSYFMCRPAYEYESEKQDLHSDLLNELTRFLYVYSGFESLLNSLRLPSCTHREGKINKAKNHIKLNYTGQFTHFVAYRDSLSTLRKLIKLSSLKRFD